MLVVTSREGLIRRYGAVGYEAVLDKLWQYTSLLETAGIDATVVPIDDEQHLNTYGLSPTPLSSAEGAVGIVRELANQADARYVMLVGSHQTLPYAKLRNPVGDRKLDPDPYVYSDLPYGATTDSLSDYLSGLRIVGRIPEPEVEGVERCLAMFDRMLRGRHTVGSSDATAIVNREWTESALRVASEIPGNVSIRVSPGYRLTRQRRDDLAREWVYVNLHGFDDDSTWRAYDHSRAAFVPVAQPESFSSPYVTGSGFFLQNCYGIRPVPWRNRESCAGRAMAEGARVVIGATGLSFGAYLHKNVHLENSDLLARLFFSAASRLPTGDALQQARRTYVQRTSRERGDEADRILLTRFELKTALQFQLLGDPSA